MYKVFINNIPLFLTADEKLTTGEKDTGKIYCQHPSEAKPVINQLKNSTLKKSVILIFPDMENILGKVFDDYIFIEAAGGVVENGEGKMLIIFRNGKWDLPKGKLDEGEVKEAAALREIEEECNIHGHSIEKELVRTYHCYPLSGKWVLKTTYWYKMKYNGNETPVPQNEEGIEKAEWRGKEEFSEVFKNTFESIKDVLSAVSG